MRRHGAALAALVAAIALQPSDRVEGQISSAADSAFFETEAFYDSVYGGLPRDSTIRALLPEYVGFGEGEKLVYSVQYGIVNAGEATLEVRNIAEINGRPCYHIVSDARSNDVFSVFFKVRDR